MFEVEITKSFSAAHQLKGYAGKCSRLHGHNYSVTIVVGANQVDKIGISLDFCRFKEIADEIIAGYDHCNLSELPQFQDCNPTSEMLAMVLFNEFKSKLAPIGVKVVRIRVGESDNTAITYFED